MFLVVRTGEVWEPDIPTRHQLSSRTLYQTDKGTNGLKIVSTCLKQEGIVLPFKQLGSVNKTMCLYPGSLSMNGLVSYDKISLNVPTKPAPLRRGKVTNRVGLNARERTKF